MNSYEINGQSVNTLSKAKSMNVLFSSKSEVADEQGMVPVPISLEVCEVVRFWNDMLFMLCFSKCILEIRFAADLIEMCLNTGSQLPWNILSCRMKIAVLERSRSQISDTRLYRVCLKPSLYPWSPHHGWFNVHFLVNPRGDAAFGSWFFHVFHRYTHHFWSAWLNRFLCRLQLGVNKGRDLVKVCGKSLPKKMDLNKNGGGVQVWD